MVKNAASGMQVGQECFLVDVYLTMSPAKGGGAGSGKGEGVDGEVCGNRVYYLLLHSSVFSSKIRGTIYNFET